MKRQVRVVPNSKKEEISEKDGVLVVHVKEPADKNKANIAVIKAVSRYFNSKARIVSGLSSRKKVVETD